MQTPRKCVRASAWRVFAEGSDGRWLQRWFHGVVTERPKWMDEANPELIMVTAYLKRMKEVGGVAIFGLLLVTDALNG